jgi:hypothetical protein
LFVIFVFFISFNEKNVNFTFCYSLYEHINDLFMSYIVSEYDYEFIYFFR